MFINPYMIPGLCQGPHFEACCENCDL